MEKTGLYIAIVALTLHGLFEILPLFFRGNPAVLESRLVPKFIFEPLQANLRTGVLLAAVLGILRLTAAAGVYLSLMWGWALGVIISIVTLNIMTLYLPVGILDGIFSGITLVSLLMAYFGGRPIP